MVGSEYEDRGVRFKLISDEALTSLPDPAWLIDDVLPLGSLVMMYGAPGSTKSFFALSMALSVGTGTPWFDRAVKSGSVLYVASEGLPGYKARTRRWKEVNDWDGAAGVHFLDGDLDLMSEAHIRSLGDMLRNAGVVPRLIIIDTLHRASSGDENSAKDAAQIVRSLTKLRKQTGATVLVVHHPRKDETAERGSSAFRGALDTMILVQNTTEGIAFHCRKMKDAAEFKPMQFRLVCDATSCVLEAQMAANTRTPKLSRQQSVCLSLLPSDGATYAEWKRAAIADGVPGSTFEKCSERLAQMGEVVLTNGRYYPPIAEESEADPLTAHDVLLFAGDNGVAIEVETGCGVTVP